MSEDIKKDESKDMADQIKICLLGGSGTGKSCFFSGLYQSMVSDVIRIGQGEDQVIVTLDVIEIDKFESFFGIGGEIKSALHNAADMRTEYLIGKEGFPPNTNETTVFTFELKINNTACCQVKITDYAGEIIDNPGESLGDDIDKLCQSLAESDAIIVIADAVKMSENINIKSDLKKVLNALDLNTIFPSIIKAAKRNNHRLSTLVALTKSDSITIPDNIRSHNFASACEKIANDVFSKILLDTQAIGGSTGVVPISAVGDNNTDEKNNIRPNADISQKNIDVSIIFCIYNAVERKIAYQERYLVELNNQLKRLGVLGNKDAKNALKGKMDELIKRRKLLINIREILKSDSNYFQESINELHMYGTSAVGETTV